MYASIWLPSSRAAAADNFAALLAENPHFIFADNTRKGYGLVDFTPTQLTTTLRVVDDVTRRDTRIETLAAAIAQRLKRALSRYA